MYKKAIRAKLRFPSNKGLLTTEDLWDLSLQELNAIAKRFNRELKQSEEEDFLKDSSVEDIKTKLSFDIVLDILNTKKEEDKARRDASKKKAEKEKILAVLEKKQEESLENLSEEELKAKLSELG